MLAHLRTLFLLSTLLGSTPFLVLSASANDNSPEVDRQGIEVHAGDALVPPPPPAGLADIYDEPAGPSQFMAGSVAVLAILPESDGSIDPSQENWTSADINTVTQQLQAALDWWETQLPDARLRFSLEVHVVPTAFEPITHGLHDEGLWIGDVLGRMGYSGNYFERAYAAAYDLRHQRGTDWATIIFVANSATTSTGRFNDGKFGYAYVNGPFMVLTSDSGSYGMNRLAPVVAHEMGHIFGALDQYKEAHIPCDRRSGYLDVPTSNSQVGGCLTNLPSIMLSPLSAFTDGAVDPSARAQVGYYDSNENGVIDPLDTMPILQLDPVEPVQPGQRPYLSGQSLDIGFPSPRHRTVSINAIDRVEYRIDGGPWYLVSPHDGAFDGSVESFHLEAPLYDGTHRLEFRAINSIGIHSAVSSLEVTVDGVGTQPNYHVQASEVSNSRVIALALEGPEDTQAVQISTDPLFSNVSWQPYTNTFSYQLETDQDGMQHFYVRFRDAAGYTSSVYPLHILLDTQPPTGRIEFERGMLPRAILVAEDQGSGVELVEVQITNGDDTWNILDGENAVRLNNQAAVWFPYTPEVLLPPKTTGVRVRFRDAAGNISEYLNAQARVMLPIIVSAH